MERKKAIEVIKNNWPDGSFTMLREALETLIPELKESEDERIRKELIDFLEYYRLNNVLDSKTIFLLTDSVAWLEKQGERKTPQWMIDFLDNYRKMIGCSLDYDEAKDVDGKILCIKDWLEKQGKQKPADKLEPKFKVKYAGSEYNVLVVKDIAGVTFYGIEDELNHIDYVKPENCEIIGSYGIKENGFSVPTKPIMFSEEKSKRMVSAEAKEAMYDKPAWSEEDERMLQKARFYVNYYQTHEADSAAAELCDNWLKSLRPQNVWISVDKEVYVKEPVLAQKKDKSNPFCGFVVCYDHTLTPNVYERYMILGNIVSQNTWKPSERQIYLLNWVTNILLKDDGIVEKETAKELQQLLEQLKKLKG